MSTADWCLAILKEAKDPSTIVQPANDKPTHAWGMTYVGIGDLEIAWRAVEQALSGARMQCRTTRLSEECLQVVGEQEAPWYDILLRARPQRMRWRIESRGAELRVSSDFHLFRWYAAVVGLLCAVILGCFVFDYLNAERRWLTGPRGTLVAAGLLTLAIVLMPVVIGLLGALGGRSGERLWQNVLHQVEQAGGHLEPHGNNLRYSVSLVSFFGFALALTLWFVGYSTRETTFSMPEGSAGFLATLFCLIAVFIVIIALMFGRRGFNLRTYPILTGLMSMLSAFFLFQTILLPWWMSSRVDFVALGAGLRPFGWFVLGASVLLAAVVVYVFFYFTLYSILAIYPQLERLHAQREKGVYRLAVGGASPLPFQIVFVLSWLLMAGLILASLAYLVACAMQGVAPLFERRELQLVNRSSQALAAAFGLTPGSRFFSILMRGLWLLAALGGMGLLLASAGQLLAGRRASRRRFAAEARSPLPRRRELEEMLEEVRLRFGLPPIRLALRADGTPGAYAERFGLWRVERYVEVTTGCLALPVEQIRAALAHECAHHALGHLAWRSFLLWLGRLSFTGDGFVYALQDSFGNESQADRAARGLGLLPECFAESLSAREPSSFKPRPGLAREASQTEKWRLARTLFRSQYCGDSLSLYYWHPSLRERTETHRDRD